MGCLIAALLYILGLAFSWGASVGVMYLVCLCFSWEFDLLIATGIWGMIGLIWNLLSKGGK